MYIMFSIDFVKHIATMTKGQVDQLPKVIIKDEKALKELLVWRDNNKDKVRAMATPIKEGTISFKHRKVFQYFKQEGDKILHMHITTEEEYIAFVFDTSDNTAQLIANTITYYDQHNALQDMITIHATVMAYMTDLGASLGDGETMNISEVR